MSKQFPALNEDHVQFIARQKIFFVATATADSRVNISPKGMDSLRVLDGSRVVWLNLTGSSSETSAHVQVHPRMTLMFCAFEGEPLILRLFGSARVVHRRDPDWEALLALFPALPGARQIFDLTVDRVQTSCGAGVPYFSHVGDRPQLNQWALKKGEDGIRRYWADRNQTSLDGLPTHIVEKNG